MKFIHNLIVMVLGCLFSLGVVEIGLRVFNYQVLAMHWTVLKKGQSFFQPDKDRIYSIRSAGTEKVYSQYYGVDQLGMRYNFDNQGEKLKDYKTIIAVGDSFTYGHEVGHDEAYPAVLGKKLRENGIEVVVHNAGVSGYGLDQEFLYIKDDLLNRFHPDLLIWNLTKNDFYDADKACLFKKTKSGWKKIITPWQSTLYVEGMLMESAPDWLKKTKIFNLLVAVPKLLAGEERFTFGCSKKNLSYNEVIILMNDKLRYFLKEVVRITDEKDIELLVVIVPFQAYFDNKILSIKDGLMDDYLLLKKTIEESKVNYIDMNFQLVKIYSPQLLSLRREGKVAAERGSEFNILGAKTINLHESMFLDETKKFNSNHLNKFGNQLMAEEVFQMIRAIDIR